MTPPIQSNTRFGQVSCFPQAKLKTLHHLIGRKAQQLDVTSIPSLADWEKAHAKIVANVFGDIAFLKPHPIVTTQSDGRGLLYVLTDTTTPDWSEFRKELMLGISKKAALEKIVNQATKENRLHRII